MLTWRELSVCATKFGVYGMFCGWTVITVTSGTGRCAGGASFEQPAANAATATKVRARRESAAAGMGGTSVVVAKRARPTRDPGRSGRAPARVVCPRLPAGRHGQGSLLGA